MKTLLGSSAFASSPAIQLPRLALALFAAVLIASSASAQTSVLWTGAADGLWTTGGNWSGGSKPAGGNYALFDGSGGTVKVDVSQNLAGLIFGSNATGGYTVQNNISAVSLTLGNGIQTSSGYTQSFSGNLSLNLNSISVNSSGGLNISTPITISAGSLTLGGSGSGSGTISAVISQSGTNGLNMNGHGSWTLNPTSSNTFTGPTSISAGSLTLDFTSFSGTPTNVLSSTAFSMSGGNLVVVGKSTGTSAQSFTTTSFGAGPATISRVINGTATNINLGTVSRTAGATVDFAAPSGASNINVSAGPLSLFGGWATLGGTDFAATDSSGNLIVATYTANTWESGINTNVTTGGTITSDSTTGSLRFNAAGSALTLSGVNTITSGGILVTSSAGASSLTGAGSTLKGASGADLVVVQNSSNTFTIGSAIADNISATGLTKSGSGTLELSGNNAYTGKTNINGGTVTVDSGSSLGTGAGGLTMLENTTLNLNNSQTLASLFGKGSVALGSSVQLTVSGASTFAGTISGSGSLLKTGNGSNLALSGVNNFSGGTTVSGGTLSLSGANTNIGNVSVSGSNSILQLGVSNALPNTNNLTLASGAHLNLQLPAGATSMTESLGTLTIATGGGVISFGPGGAATLTFADSHATTWSAAGLTIMNYVTGTSVLQFVGDPSPMSDFATQVGLITFSGYLNGGAAQIDGSGFVTPTGGSAIPEPSTYAALFGVSALVAAIYRRQRGRKLAA